MSTTRALRAAWMLLLVSQIRCDWVEIEQDHYKPYIKPINNNLRASNAAPAEETTKYGAANNKYNEDKKWSKGAIDRVSNVGNIRRVLTPSVKTTSIKFNNAENMFKKNVPDTDDVGDKPEHRNFPHRHYFTERPSLSNYRTTQESLGRLKSVPNNFDKDKLKYTDGNINKFNKNSIYQMQTLNEQSSNNENKKIIIRNDSSEDDSDNNFQVIKFGHTRTSPKPNIFERRSSTTSKSKILRRKQNTEHVMLNFDDKNIKYPNSSVTKPTQGRITEIDTSSGKTTKLKILHRNPTSENILSEKSEEEEELLNKQQPKTREGAKKDKNDKSMDGMLKLVKAVSDIIYKNTHRSFKGKVKYLEGLKSTLLTTIEDHIDKVWPDDSDRTRQAREARGHLEVPSSESALMTISFLTFAVFLIKLVLQVIHTYKNKTMMVTPTVVAAVGRVARAIRSNR